MSRESSPHHACRRGIAVTFSSRHAVQALRRSSVVRIAAINGIADAMQAEQWSISIVMPRRRS